MLSLYEKYATGLSNVLLLLLVLVLWENTGSMPFEGVELFYVQNSSLGVIRVVH